MSERLERPNLEQVAEDTTFPESNPLAYELAHYALYLEEALREHKEKLGGSVHTPQAQHVWAKATVRLWEVLRHPEAPTDYDRKINAEAKH